MALRQRARGAITLVTSDSKTTKLRGKKRKKRRRRRRRRGDKKHAVARRRRKFVESASGQDVRSRENRARGSRAERLNEEERQRLFLSCLQYRSDTHGAASWRFYVGTYAGGYRKCARVYFAFTLRFCVSEREPGDGITYSDDVAATYSLSPFK